MSLLFALIERDDAESNTGRAERKDKAEAVEMREPRRVTRKVRPERIDAEHFCTNIVAHANRIVWSRLSD